MGLQYGNRRAFFANVVISNLIFNGTFNVDLYWTKGTGWTIGGGVASIDGSNPSTSSLSQISLIKTLANGATYTYSITITARTAGGLFMRIGGGSLDFVGNAASGTPYTGTIVAGATQVIEVAAITGGILSIDDFELYEA